MTPVSVARRTVTGPERAGRTVAASRATAPDAMVTGPGKLTSAPDFAPVEEPSAVDGLVILDEDPPLTRLDPQPGSRRSTAPPPAPRLRSEVVAEEETPMFVDSAQAEAPEALEEEGELDAP